MDGWTITSPSDYPHSSTMAQWTIAWNPLWLDHEACLQLTFSLLSRCGARISALFDGLGLAVFPILSNNCALLMDKLNRFCLFVVGLLGRKLKAIVCRQMILLKRLTLRFIFINQVEISYQALVPILHCTWMDKITELFQYSKVALFPTLTHH